MKEIIRIVYEEMAVDTTNEEVMGIIKEIKSLPKGQAMAGYESAKKTVKEALSKKTMTLQERDDLCSHMLF